MKPKERLALVAQGESDSIATVRLLGELGWTAMVVPTWVDAEKQLRRSKFEVMITDYDLAGGDGFDLIVNWREREIYMRVLFAMAQPAERCVSVEVLGLCGVLPKPFSGDQLKKALKRVLTLKWSVDTNDD